MTERELKYWARIPKKYQKMIDTFSIDEKIDYCEKTGKMLNRYNLKLKEGFVAEDGNEEISFCSFDFMVWKFRNGSIIKCEK